MPLIDYKKQTSLMGGDVLGTSSPYSGGAVFSANANTGVLGIHSLYACTDSSSNPTLTILSAAIATASPQRPWIFCVKDEAGNAGTNNFTLATEGGELINGAASLVFTANFQVALLYTNGSDLYLYA